MKPNDIKPIWTPKDSVDTANDFHAHLDHAETGRWFISQSRHRKAAVMDGAAVTLLLAFMAFFGVILFALAVPR